MRGKVFLTMLALLAGTTLAAQQGKSVQTGVGDGGSPHWHTEWIAAGAHIAIDYGRPFLKGRKIGGEVAPYDTEWRVGADEATTLVTDKPLRFGSLAVPAGTYTLYAVSNASQWILVVSKKTGQWGIPYPAGEDLGRAPMQVGKNAQPVEQVTLAIDPTAKGGILHIKWGLTDAHIAFTVG